VLTVSMAFPFHRILGCTAKKNIDCSVSTRPKQPLTRQLSMILLSHGEDRKTGIHSPLGVDGER
jgi:hypothetical protein